MSDHETSNFERGLQRSRDAKTYNNNSCQKKTSLRRVFDCKRPKKSKTQMTSDMSSCGAKINKHSHFDYTHPTFSAFYCSGADVKC